MNSKMKFVGNWGRLGMKFNIWEDCPKVPITELLSFIVDNRGKTVPTANDGWKLIATNCVTNNTLFPVYEKVRYFTQETYETWFRAHPMPGDILFVNKGTPGRVCMVPDPVDFCIAQDMIALRADDKKIYNKYLFAVLRSREIQQQIYNTNVGDVIPHFKKQFMDQLLIPVPDRKIQEKIGNLYYQLSYKVELNKKINENLEQQIESILLKTIDNANTQPVKLGDYLYIKGRIGWKGLKKSEYLPISDYRIINGESLTLSGIDWNKAGYISAERYEESPEIMLNIGDILLSKDGTIGKIGYVDKLEIPSSVASGIFVIRNTRQTEISTQFIYYLLKSRLFKAFITSRTEGSVIPHLYQKDFMEFEFQLPSPDDMKIFDDTTAAMFSMVFSNLNENERLIHLRDSLLPKLMSGAIDVSELDL